MATTNFADALKAKVTKTIGEHITDELVKQGIEEAVAAHLEFADGRTKQVISTADPVLDEEILEGVEPPVVTFSASAKAGRA